MVMAMTDTPDAELPKMLPCPFCGGTNVDLEGWLSGSAADGYMKGPACYDCGGSTDEVERWNNRLDAPPQGVTLTGEETIAVNSLRRAFPFPGNDVAKAVAIIDRLTATAPGKVASLADIYAKLRSSLYAKTKRDWQLTVHVTLTEPTCPTVVIDEEGGKSSRYRFDRDTIEEGVAAAVDAVYREVILGEKVAPECPWTDAPPATARADE